MYVFANFTEGDHTGRPKYLALIIFILNVRI